MSIIDQLATSLNRRDEVANQELAARIVAADDTAAVQELVDHLTHKSRDIQSDCIKTLYEIGAQKPSLIAPHMAHFVGLLDSKNNRMQWGAMAALDRIAAVQPDELYAILPQLAAAAEKGTVITRDHYIGILVKLLKLKKYADDAFHLLNEQLISCRANQLPMYAEGALPFVPEQHRAALTKTLTGRLGDFEKESKRKRLEAVLKKLDRK